MKGILNNLNWEYPSIIEKKCLLVSIFTAPKYVFLFAANLTPGCTLGSSVPAKLVEPLKVNVHPLVNKPHWKVNNQGNLKIQF